MNTPLRTLIIEDSEDDAKLLLLELKRGGYEAAYQRVDSSHALNKALESDQWDIVFADFTMPGFSGTQALSMVRDRGFDVPFIFVSGTIGEDTAVAAMKSGAQDYIMKGNLKRLLPAVERELREAGFRRMQRRIEEEMGLLQAITQASTNAGDIYSALTVALDMIHDVTGWAMAQVWLPNPAGTMLECSPVWRCHDKSLEMFRSSSIGVSFSLGEDLPGRAWLSRQSNWVRDVTSNPDFRRSSIIDAAALNTAAIAIPVLAGDEVVAVLEFFTRVPSENDERSVKFITAVATQLGGIIQRKRAEERLLYLAHYDSLTGLPNRILFMDRLRQALAEANRNKRLVAVIFMDLDRFKPINDTLGHDMGDQFLKSVAERVVKCVREGDTVSRLAGDEFAMILRGLTQVDNAARVAQKVLDELLQPFQVEGHELFISASIGVTIYPFDESDFEGLLRNADMAMYRAKERGGNTYDFYGADLAFKAQARMAVEIELRHALDRRQFELYYQPLVDLKSGRIHGVEALIRWRRSETDLVLPEEFISVAEETGLIVPIGEWVMRTACRQCHAGGFNIAPNLRLAVNVSPRQFASGQLSEVVSKIIEETGFDPSQLDIEITETLLMESADTAVAVMRDMGEMNVHFSIDDFGTGYSNLNYLKHLPIDQVKIDKSFVSGVPTHADDSAIVSAIISMAHNMGLKVIAEGVETREQLQFLREHHCDSVQGNYFSPPVPFEMIARFTADNKTLSRF